MRTWELTTELTALDLESLLTDIPDLSDVVFDFDNDNATDADEWVTFEFRVPKAAEHVIEDEIERMMSLHEFQPNVPEIMRRGLMIVKVCINSWLTPIESLV